MSPALQAVEAVYFTAQQKLNDMLAACPDQASRDQIMTQYVNARQNYFACINKTFHDDDPALATLVDQENASAKELSAIDAQLGDIAKVIDTITKGVTCGAQIVQKIIAL
jgi:hypothetical protein